MTIMATEQEQKTADNKIESVPTKGNVMDISAPTLAVDLPCGYLDAEGRAHRTLVVREMCGHEEDLLAGKGAILPRLNQILVNCTVRLGEITERADIASAVSSLSASDRMVAFLALRRVSLGDLYVIKVTCPNPECGDTARFSPDLSKLEISAMVDPGKREFEHTIPSGKVVKWHIMTTADEEWLSTKTKKREDVLTLGLMARVDEIDGVSLDREKSFPSALRVLQGLSMRDRGELRMLFDENEGSVETTLEFTCPTCGFEWKSDLNMGRPDFFFPSAR